MTLLTMYCIFTPFVAAIISSLLGKYEKLRNAVVILATFISLGLSVLIAQAPARTVCFASLNFQIGGFNSTYAIIAAFMWFAAALLSPQYFKGHHKLSRYYFFFLLRPAGCGACCIGAGQSGRGLRSDGYHAGRIG